MLRSNPRQNCAGVLRGTPAVNRDRDNLLMILGLGNDVVDIRRIEASLARFGDRFIQRVFTPIEQKKSERRPDGRHRSRAASYAKRFAAKEACAKALGTGLRRGVYWRDMGVVNLASGQPTLQLTGGAARRLVALVPPGLQPIISLTMTDEYPLAAAVVIISAIPAGSGRVPGEAGSR